jgi:hypothetical protein
MPVGVIQEFAEGSLDQYDQVIEKMGFTPGGAGPVGNMFHWVTEIDGHVRITDVWETREQFEQFAQETIGPLAAEVGVPQPPEVTYFEVHSFLTAG